MRSKARLTITLSHELLNRLDRAIDGRRLLNRSHAIETLLRGSLRPTVRNAVILAGGEHGRDHNPAAAQIDGRPLIVHTIQHLVDAGIRSLHVLAGADEPEIRNLIGDELFGASIHYVREDRRLGTAGALKLAEPHLEGEPFLVIHGDVLTDIDIAAFIDFHLNEQSMATIAVKPRQSEPHYGQVILQGNRITQFFESGPAGVSIVNTGVYLFQPGVFELIEEGPRDPAGERRLPTTRRDGRAQCVSLSRNLVRHQQAGESPTSAGAMARERGLRTWRTD